MRHRTARVLNAEHTHTARTSPAVCLLRVGHGVQLRAREVEAIHREQRREPVARARC
jgi:hypothetical protein